MAKAAKANLKPFIFVLVSLIILLIAELLILIRRVSNYSKENLRIISIVRLIVRFIIALFLNFAWSFLKSNVFYQGAYLGFITNALVSILVLGPVNTK